MTTNEVYQFDEAGRFWKRTINSVDFVYSDGDEVENYILDVIRKSSDKTAGSEELARFIKDWPTEYHFSAFRHNLLLPFQFTGLDVLEIGSGCGAITRFLGESGARVMALEGSPRRARITAARCEDLEDIEVFCDNFQSFVCDRKFDVVTAIGVIEYAPGFFEGKDPVRSFLEKAGQFLKPNGTIIIAIENQLGLKYFAGCSEDHTGELFYGIEDRYGETSSVVTLGKSELASKLRQSGFSEFRFFYPFPDYKLPRLMFSEEGLMEQQLGAGRMIGEVQTRDYGRSRMSLFSEETAWEVLGRNSLASEMANSFLVMASTDRSNPFLSGTDWLGKCFASYRRKKYRTITTFKRATRKRVPNRIKVIKEIIHEGLSESGSSMVRLRVPSEVEFVPGSTLKRNVAQRLLDPQATISQILGLLEQWTCFLKKNVNVRSDDANNHYLPGDFIDCVPWNLVVHSPLDDDLVYFDREWDYLLPLPLELPLVRGFLYLGIHPANSQLFGKITIRELMRELASRSGISLTDNKLRSMLECEALFIHETHDVSPVNWLDTQMAAVQQAYGAPLSLRQVINEREHAESTRKHEFQGESEALFEAHRQIQELENSLQERDSQISQLQEWVRTDDGELEKLKEQVRGKEADVVRLEGLVHEKESLEAQFHSLVEERDNRLKELTGVIQERDAQISQLQEWVREDDAELERLKEQVRNKEAEVARASDENQSKVREIELLEKQLNEKESQLNGVYRSTSWRITRPVRYVGVRLRRTPN